jgi:hypothetical protein
MRSREGELHREVRLGELIGLTVIVGLASLLLALFAALLHSLPLLTLLIVAAEVFTLCLFICGLFIFTYITPKQLKQLFQDRESVSYNHFMTLRTKGATSR